MVRVSASLVRRRMLQQASPTARPSLQAQTARTHLDLRNRRRLGTTATHGMRAAVTKQTRKQLHLQLLHRFRQHPRMPTKARNRLMTGRKTARMMHLHPSLLLVRFSALCQKVITHSSVSRVENRSRAACAQVRNSFQVSSSSKIGTASKVQCTGQGRTRDFKGCASSQGQNRCTSSRVIRRRGRLRRRRL